MQHLVAEMCTEYFLRYRRQRHVTPKSYLSFLSGYKTTYQTKREELQMLVNRMNTGLKRLVEAAESVFQTEARGGQQACQACELSARANCI